MVDMLKNQKFYFIIYLLILILGLGLLINKSKEDLFFLINGNHSPLLDTLYYYGTSLGNAFMFIPLILISLCFKYKNIFTITFAVLIQTIIVHLFKRVLFESSLRPIEYFRLSGITDLHFVEGVKVHSLHTFPSGHTATAFCVFTLLAIIINRKYLGMLFIVPALVVGISRIYLAQHFFLDVYIGSMIGIITAVLSYWLVNIKSFHPLYNKNWPEKRFTF